MGVETTGPATIYRKDYAAYPYVLESVNFKFELGEESTTVTGTYKVVPNHGGEPPSMVLQGTSMDLKSIKVDGSDVPSDKYKVDEKSLCLESLPAGEFTLEMVTEIKPQENTSCEGLYKSSGNFCTQCEAEGFRRIMYFPDRPDVMSKYTVRIEADKDLYPVLLSNGNLQESGDLTGNKHYAVWVDPFKKPCYLFALVAGQLKKLEDTFTTASGKEVQLRIFVEEHDLPKCSFAMESLKKAMKWDEDVFGLEYDLDLFNIVAVHDFNMGAMENKSLNIFNSRLVLATPETATDSDYFGIERVVAHEYFHNWTGNRVTCQDWFQLSLKEGLTVYRDQEFSADMNSRGTRRISDVATLRAAQFPQDAGPMAHPVRPDSYIKMDNFYTVTVYNKGAEVVRMYRTLLGVEGFRKGMDLYFRRHDGCAVTCDDFLSAMADANGADLSQFSTWYSQAGTPRLEVESSYDADAQTFSLLFRQSCPPTPGQEDKKPFLLPIRMGLIGSESGKELPLNKEGATDLVLRMTETEQLFTFSNITERPIPSLLRGFSAPVILTSDLSDEDRVFLVANDTDEFNRWEQLQALSRNLLLSLLEDYSAGKQLEMDTGLVEAIRKTISNPQVDNDFKRCVLSLPGEGEISEMVSPANPAAIHEVREFAVLSMVTALEGELRQLFEECSTPAGEPFSPDPASMARRGLCNTSLGLLCKLKTDDMVLVAERNYNIATNMTDSFAALAAASSIQGPRREAMLTAFYKRWAEDPLVLNKWLSLQAGSNIPGNLANVQALLEHPAFDISNPNKVYSLLGGFCSSSVNFHAEDGSGYKFLADMILKLDGMNAQVASRMASPFTRWRKYDEVRADKMHAQLQRILAAKDNLSPNTFEIVSKSLE